MTMVFPENPHKSIMEDVSIIGSIITTNVSAENIVWLQ